MLSNLNMAEHILIYSENQLNCFSLFIKGSAGEFGQGVYRDRQNLNPVI